MQSSDSQVTIEFKTVGVKQVLNDVSALQDAVDNQVRSVNVLNERYNNLARSTTPDDLYRADVRAFAIANGLTQDMGVSLDRYAARRGITYSDRATNSTKQEEAFNKTYNVQKTVTSNGVEIRNGSDFNGLENAFTKVNDLMRDFGTEMVRIQELVKGFSSDTPEEIKLTAIKMQNDLATSLTNTKKLIQSFTKDKFIKDFTTNGFGSSAYERVSNTINTGFQTIADVRNRRNAISTVGTDGKVKLLSNDEFKTKFGVTQKEFDAIAKVIPNIIQHEMASLMSDRSNPRTITASSIAKQIVSRGFSGTNGGYNLGKSNTVDTLVGRYEGITSGQIEKMVEYAIKDRLSGLVSMDPYVRRNVFGLGKNFDEAVSKPIDRIPQFAKDVYAKVSEKYIPGSNASGFVPTSVVAQLRNIILNGAKNRKGDTTYSTAIKLAQQAGLVTFDKGKMRFADINKISNDQLAYFGGLAARESRRLTESLPMYLADVNSEADTSSTLRRQINNRENRGLLNVLDIVGRAHGVNSAYLYKDKPGDVSFSGIQYPTGKGNEVKIGTTGLKESYIVPNFKIGIQENGRSGWDPVDYRTRYDNIAKLSEGTAKGTTPLRTISESMFTRMIGLHGNGTFGMGRDVNDNIIFPDKNHHIPMFVAPFSQLYTTVDDKNGGGQKTVLKYDPERVGEVGYKFSQEDKQNYEEFERAVREGTNVDGEDYVAAYADKNNVFFVQKSIVDKRNKELTGKGLSPISGAGTYGTIFDFLNSADSRKSMAKQIEASRKIASDSIDLTSLGYDKDNLPRFVTASNEDLYEMFGIKANAERRKSSVFDGGVLINSKFGLDKVAQVRLGGGGVKALMIPENFNEMFTKGNLLEQIRNVNPILTRNINDASKDALYLPMSGINDMDLSDLDKIINNSFSKEEASKLGTSNLSRLLNAVAKGKLSSEDTKYLISTYFNDVLDDTVGGIVMDSAIKTASGYHDMSVEQAKKAFSKKGIFAGYNRKDLGRIVTDKATGEKHFQLNALGQSIYLNAENAEKGIGIMNFSNDLASDKYDGFIPSSIAVANGLNTAENVAVSYNEIEKEKRELLKANSAKRIKYLKSLGYSDEEIAANGSSIQRMIYSRLSQLDERSSKGDLMLPNLKTVSRVSAPMPGQIEQQIAQMYAFEENNVPNMNVELGGNEFFDTLASLIANQGYTISHIGPNGSAKGRKGKKTRDLGRTIIGRNPAAPGQNAITTMYSDAYLMEMAKKANQGWFNLDDMVFYDTIENQYKQNTGDYDADVSYMFSGNLARANIDKIKQMNDAMEAAGEAVEEEIRRREKIEGLVPDADKMKGMKQGNAAYNAIQYGVSNANAQLHMAQNYHAMHNALEMLKLGNGENFDMSNIQGWETVYRAMLGYDAATTEAKEGKTNSLPRDVAMALMQGQRTSAYFSKIAKWNDERDAGIVDPTAGRASVFRLKLPGSDLAGLVGLSAIFKQRQEGGDPNKGFESNLKKFIEENSPDDYTKSGKLAATKWADILSNIEMGISLYDENDLNEMENYIHQWEREIDSEKNNVSNQLKGKLKKDERTNLEDRLQKLDDQAKEAKTAMRRVSQARATEQNGSSLMLENVRSNYESARSNVESIEDIIKADYSKYLEGDSRYISSDKLKKLEADNINDYKKYMKLNTQRMALRTEINTLEPLVGGNSEAAALVRTSKDRELMAERARGVEEYNRQLEAMRRGEYYDEGFSTQTKMDAIITQTSNLTPEKLSYNWSSINPLILQAARAKNVDLAYEATVSKRGKISERKNIGFKPFLVDRPNDRGTYTGTYGDEEEWIQKQVDRNLAIEMMQAAGLNKTMPDVFKTLQSDSGPLGLFGSMVHEGIANVITKKVSDPSYGIDIGKTLLQMLTNVPENATGQSRMSRDLIDKYKEIFGDSPLFVSTNPGDPNDNEVVFNSEAFNKLSANDKNAIKQRFDKLMGHVDNGGYKDGNIEMLQSYLTELFGDDDPSKNGRYRMSVIESNKFDENGMPTGSEARVNKTHNGEPVNLGYTIKDPNGTILNGQVNSQFSNDLVRYDTKTGKLLFVDWKPGENGAEDSIFQQAIYALDMKKKIEEANKLGNSKDITAKLNELGYIKSGIAIQDGNGKYRLNDIEGAVGYGYLSGSKISVSGHDFQGLIDSIDLQNIYQDAINMKAGQSIDEDAKKRAYAYIAERMAKEEGASPEARALQNSLLTENKSASDIIASVLKAQASAGNNDSLSMSVAQEFASKVQAEKIASLIGMVDESEKNAQKNMYRAPYGTILPTDRMKSSIDLERERLVKAYKESGVEDTIKQLEDEKERTTDALKIQSINSELKTLNEVRAAYTRLVGTKDSNGVYSEGDLDKTAFNAVINRGAGNINSMYQELLGVKGSTAAQEFIKRKNNMNAQKAEFEAFKRIYHGEGIDDNNLVFTVPDGKDKYFDGKTPAEVQSRYEEYLDSMRKQQEILDTYLRPTQEREIYNLNKAFMSASGRGRNRQSVDEIKNDIGTYRAQRYMQLRADAEKKIEDYDSVLKNNDQLSESEINVYKDQKAKAQALVSKIDKELGKMGESGDVTKLVGNGEAFGMSSIGKEVSSGLNRIGRVITGLIRRYSRKLIQDARQSILSTNESMTNIQMITGNSDEEMQYVRQQSFSKAQELHTSVGNVMKAEEILYRQGLNDSDVSSRIESVIMLAKDAGISIESSAKAITVALKNDLVKSAEEASDVLVALGDNAATTAEEIANALKRSGAAAKEAGVDYASLATLITIGTSSTQLSGQVVGTSLSTFFNRMQRVTNEKYITDEEGGSTSINDVEAALKSSGISLREEGGNSFRSIMDVFKDIALQWGDMNDLQKANISNVIAGSGGRRTNVFQAIMEQMYAEAEEGKNFDDLLGIAENAEGTTKSKYEIAITSISTAITDLKTQFQSLVEEIESDNFISGIIESISNLVKGLTNATKALGAVGPVILTLTPILAALAVKFATTALSAAAFGVATGNYAKAALTIGSIAALMGVGLGIAGSFSTDNSSANRSEIIANNQDILEGKQADYEYKNEYVSDKISKLEEISNRKPTADLNEDAIVNEFNNTVGSVKDSLYSLSDSAINAAESLDDMPEIIQQIKDANQKDRESYGLGTLIPSERIVENRLALAQEEAEEEYRSAYVLSTASIKNIGTQIEDEIKTTTSKSIEDLTKNGYTEWTMDTTGKRRPSNYISSILYDYDTENGTNFADSKKVKDTISKLENYESELINLDKLTDENGNVISSIDRLDSGDDFVGKITSEGINNILEDFIDDIGMHEFNTRYGDYQYENGQLIENKKATKRISGTKYIYYIDNNDNGEEVTRGENVSKDDFDKAIKRKTESANNLIADMNKFVTDSIMSSIDEATQLVIDYSKMYRVEEIVTGALKQNPEAISELYRATSSLINGSEKGKDYIDKFYVDKDGNLNEYGEALKELKVLSYDDYNKRYVFNYEQYIKNQAEADLYHASDLLSSATIDFASNDQLNAVKAYADEILKDYVSYWEDFMQTVYDSTTEGYGIVIQSLLPESFASEFNDFASDQISEIFYGAYKNGQDGLKNSEEAQALLKGTDLLESKQASDTADTLTYEDLANLSAQDYMKMMYNYLEKEGIIENDKGTYSQIENITENDLRQKVFDSLLNSNNPQELSKYGFGGTYEVGDKTYWVTNPMDVQGSLDEIKWQQKKSVGSEAIDENDYKENVLTISGSKVFQHLSEMISDVQSSRTNKDRGYVSTYKALSNFLLGNKDGAEGAGNLLVDQTIPDLKLLLEQDKQLADLLDDYINGKNGITQQDIIGYISTSTVKDTTEMISSLETAGTVVNGLSDAFTNFSSANFIQQMKGAADAASLLQTNKRIITIGSDTSGFTESDWNTWAEFFGLENGYALRENSDLYKDSMQQVINASKKQNIATAQMELDNGMTNIGLLQSQGYSVRKKKQLPYGSTGDRTLYDDSYETEYVVTDYNPVVYSGVDYMYYSSGIEAQHNKQNRIDAFYDSIKNYTTLDAIEKAASEQFSKEIGEGTFANEFGELNGILGMLKDGKDSIEYFLYKAAELTSYGDIVRGRKETWAMNKMTDLFGWDVFAQMGEGNFNPTEEQIAEYREFLNTEEGKEWKSYMGSTIEDFVADILILGDAMSHTDLEAKAAAQDMKELAAQTKANEIKATKKYGTKSDEVADFTANLYSGGMSRFGAISTLTKAAQQAYNQSYAISRANGKSGNGIRNTPGNDKIMNFLTGGKMDTTDIKGYSKTQIQALVDVAQVDLQDQLALVQGEAQELLNSMSTEDLTAFMNAKVKLGIDTNNLDLIQTSKVLKEAGLTELSAALDAVTPYITGQVSIRPVTVTDFFELTSPEGETTRFPYVKDVKFEAVVSDVNTKKGDGFKGVKGSGGGKSRAQKAIEKSKRALSLVDHRLNLNDERGNYYKERGELTNYGTTLSERKDLLGEKQDVIDQQIKSLKTALKKEKKDSDDYNSIYDEILSLEEERNKVLTQTEQVINAMKENDNAIREVANAISKYTLDVYTDIENQAENILNATTNMQNEILNVIRNRYQEEWDLIKEDVERKRKALDDEKQMISDRLNARKEAADEAEKYEELAELQAQLAAISKDSTRTKDQAELRNRISELQEEISWDIAEDEANAQQEEIDKQLEAYDQYVEYGDKMLDEFLEDANNFTEEIEKVMSESGSHIVEWMKENNEEFKNSTAEMQEEMINGWNDTIDQINGIFNKYKESVNDFMDKLIAEYSKATTAQEREAAKENAITAYLEQSHQTEEYKSLSTDKERATFDYERTKEVEAMIAAEVVDPNASVLHTNASPIDSENQNAAYTQSNGGHKWGYMKVNGSGVESVYGDSSMSDADMFKKVYNAAVAYYKTASGSSDPKQAKLAKGYLADIKKMSAKNYNSPIFKKYKLGGDVDYTGLAMVHGTPTNPEAFLDAEDRNSIRAMLNAITYVRGFNIAPLDTSIFGEKGNSIGDINIEINNPNVSSEQDIDELIKRLSDALSEELEKNGFNTSQYNFG